MAGKGIFEVERILKTKTRPGKSNLYYIRWQGYDSDEDSWEPEENLINCPEILEAFTKVNVSQTSKKSTPSRASKASKSPARASARKTTEKRTTSPSRISTRNQTSEKTSISTTRSSTISQSVTPGATASTFARTERSLLSSYSPSPLRRPPLRTRGRLSFGAGDVSPVTRSASSGSDQPVTRSRRCDVVLIVFFLFVAGVTVALFLQKPEILP